MKHVFAFTTLNFPIYIILSLSLNFTAPMPFLAKVLCTVDDQQGVSANNNNRDEGGCWCWCQKFMLEMVISYGVSPVCVADVDSNPSYWMDLQYNLWGANDPGCK